MLININRLNLIARSIYSNVSYRYIFVIGPYTIVYVLYIHFRDRYPVPVAEHGTGSGTSDRAWYQFRISLVVPVPNSVPVGS